MPGKNMTKWLREQGVSLTTKQDGERSIAGFLLQEFSPVEALSVAQVTSDTLAKWYERRLLPRHDFPDVAPGRGKKRWYTFAQTVVLGIARALIETGLPVEVAMDLASSNRREHQPFSLFDHVFSLIYCSFGQDLETIRATSEKEEVPLALIGKTPHGFCMTFGSFESIRSFMRPREGPHFLGIVTFDMVGIAARILDGLYRLNLALCIKSGEALPPWMSSWVNAGEQRMAQAALPLPAEQAKTPRARKKRE